MTKNNDGYYTIDVESILQDKRDQNNLTPGIQELEDIGVGWEDTVYYKNYTANMNSYNSFMKLHQQMIDGNTPGYTGGYLDHANWYKSQAELEQPRWEHAQEIVKHLESYSTSLEFKLIGLDVVLKDIDLDS